MLISFWLVLISSLKVLCLSYTIRENANEDGISMQLDPPRLLYSSCKATSRMTTTITTTTKVTKSVDKESGEVVTTTTTTTTTESTNDSNIDPAFASSIKSEQVCMRLMEAIFEPSYDIDIAINQFNRYLPVYVHTQLSMTAPLLPSRERELLYTHERFNILGPVGPICKQNEIIFVGDTISRSICGLKEVKQEECIIYSFIYSSQTEIDCSVELGIIRENPQCRIEIFLCNNDIIVPQMGTISSQIRFHKVCLSLIDEDVKETKYRTWSSINNITGLSEDSAGPFYVHIHHYNEGPGAVLPLLRSMVEDGSQLPLQIGLTLTFSDPTNPISDRVSSLELYTFMQYLRMFGGYYLSQRNDQSRCEHCTDLLLSRMRCSSCPVQNGGRDNTPSMEAFRQLLDVAKDTPSLENSLKYSFLQSYYNDK